MVVPPCLSCRRGKVGGVLVEKICSIFGFAIGDQGFSPVFDGWYFVKSFLLEAVGGTEQGFFGAAPLNGGQLVGLTVVPNPSLVAVTTLTTFVEAFWQCGRS